MVPAMAAAAAGFHGSARRTVLVAASLLCAASAVTHADASAPPGASGVPVDAPEHAARLSTGRPGRRAQRAHSRVAASALQADGATSPMMRREVTRQSGNHKKAENLIQGEPGEDDDGSGDDLTKPVDAEGETFQEEEEEANHETTANKEECEEKCGTEPLRSTNIHFCDDECKEESEEESRLIRLEEAEEEANAETTANKEEEEIKTTGEATVNEEECEEKCGTELLRVKNIVFCDDKCKEESEGESRMFRLEFACSEPRDGSDAAKGRFERVGVKAGMVQCCHKTEAACARKAGELCFSDKNHTFGEAFNMCEAEGMRLCSQEELRSHHSLGCCDSGCGMDNALVWTITQSTVDEVQMLSEELEDEEDETAHKVETLTSEVNTLKREHSRLRDDIMEMLKGIIDARGNETHQYVLPKGEGCPCEDCSPLGQELLKVIVLDFKDVHANGMTDEVCHRFREAREVLNVLLTDHMNKHVSMKECVEMCGTAELRSADHDFCTDKCKEEHITKTNTGQETDWSPCDNCAHMETMLAKLERQLRLRGRSVPINEDDLWEDGSRDWREIWGEECEEKCWTETLHSENAAFCNDMCSRECKEQCGTETLRVDHHAFCFATCSREILQFLRQKFFPEAHILPEECEEECGTAELRSTNHKFCGNTCEAFMEALESAEEGGGAGGEGPNEEEHTGGTKEWSHECEEKCGTESVLATNSDFCYHNCQGTSL